MISPPSTSNETRPIRPFKNLIAKIALLPMIAAALVVFVGGTVWSIIYSFTGSRLLPKENWVGLDQYERLWASERWIISIKNLGIYGSCAMLLTLLLGFFLAACLDRKIRFEGAFRTIFLYPFALSFVVTGLAWQWILNPDFGVPNTLHKWGWESFSFNPLNDPNTVIYGLLIAGVWQGSGLIMCIMLAGLRSVDDEIWHAARLDGIGTIKTYVAIIIPMIRPAFATALILIAAGIIKLYDLVIALTDGGPGLASEVPAKYVIDYMFKAQNLGQGLAASTMMLCSVAIVLIPWAYLEFAGRKRG
ncbi:carbohydrate ABC transporter permease [Planktotalea sp.]|uniref:carbohydrate ABC transporter permease n=1 Tax=Planktotalea sp. TaxID=2029877 RepID=UPI003D6A1AE9